LAISTQNLEIFLGLIPAASFAIGFATAGAGTVIGRIAVKHERQLVYGSFSVSGGHTQDGQSDPAIGVRGVERNKSAKDDTGFLVAALAVQGVATVRQKVDFLGRPTHFRHISSPRYGSVLRNDGVFGLLHVHQHVEHYAHGLLRVRIPGGDRG
jgi:hypothetical protein